jgi:CubicO group peptidase (beta-lactamase class C family)
MVLRPALRIGLGATIGAALLSVSSQATSNASLSASALSSIADIANQEIANGHVPGAVVLIGQGHEIVYRQAFGLRATQPQPVPMTVDTIFDLASLTKVVATTTAVVQLVERGRLELDASASKYWPAFGTVGKQTITVRDLLTHYSGLKPDLSLNRRWSGYETAMRLLVSERPLHPAHTTYIYSDENFEVLGEIARRVSGMTLDGYCDEHIFAPLGMGDTRFRLRANQASRVAPTSMARANGIAPVAVNDPTAQRMGGIAGHAGLFSTADDLATFAMMLLDWGTLRGVHVLSRDSVAAMTQPASPPAGSHTRGLGWDLGDPLASADGGESIVPSYGHTGFTGTMLWIDPASRRYTIVLSNRTYPDGRGDAQPLRKAILARVSGASTAAASAGGADPDRAAHPTINVR